MATAIKRGNSWRIQPFKLLPNGKRVRTSITAPTKKEAERLATLWLEEIEEKNTPQKTMTLGDVLDQYIDTCRAQKLSPSTIREYVSRRQNSFPSIIDTKLSLLTVSAIQEQINERANDGIKPKTLRNDISLLKGAFTIYAPHINLSSIKIAKKTKRKKLEFKSSWQHDVPAKMAELYGKDDCYLYILFIIYAGLRPSETYALTWGDISKKPIVVHTDTVSISIGTIDISKARIRGEDGEYENKEPKTESGNRLIKVPWELITELLSVHSRGSDDEQILVYKPYSGTHQWKAVKEALNLPAELRRYDLRHFYATSKVLAGATEEELQQDMGHSTAQFTHNVYVEIMEEHKEAVNIKFALDARDSIMRLKNI